MIQSEAAIDTLRRYNIVDLVFEVTLAGSISWQGMKVLLCEANLEVEINLPSWKLTCKLLTRVLLNHEFS